MMGFNMSTFVTRLIIVTGKLQHTGMLRKFIRVMYLKKSYELETYILRKLVIIVL